MAITTSCKNDKDFNWAWGNNNQTAFKKIIQECANNGYTDVAINLDACGSWSSNGTCMNHSSSVEGSVRSKPYSDESAREAGFNTPKEAMISDCKRKGFGGIVNSNFYNIANKSVAYGAACSDPNTQVNEGTFVRCADEGNGVVFYVKDGLLYGIPNPDIAKSYDEGYAGKVQNLTCKGLTKSTENLSKKPISIPSQYRYRGNNGSVTGSRYCQGNWESICPGYDKNLLCTDGIDPNTGKIVGCESTGKTLFWNCDAQIAGTSILTKKICTEKEDAERVKLEQKMLAIKVQEKENKQKIENLAAEEKNNTDRLAKEQGLRYNTLNFSPDMIHIKNEKIEAKKKLLEMQNSYMTTYITGGLAITLVVILLVYFFMFR